MGSNSLDFLSISSHLFLSLSLSISLKIVITQVPQGGSTQLTHSLEYAWLSILGQTSQESNPLSRLSRLCVRNRPADSRWPSGRRTTLSSKMSTTQEPPSSTRPWTSKTQVTEENLEKVNKSGLRWKAPWWQNNFCEWLGWRHHGCEFILQC